MIDERHIELIHADLDGELSADQRAELARVLLANPEARALRDELSRLFGELARLDEVPPPAGLTDSVLSRMTWARPSRRSFGISGGWDGRTALRYAAVFVGILLLGGVLFAPGLRNSGGLDVSELVGTIGGDDNAVQKKAIDRAQLDLPQVTGSVNSYRLGTQVVVELNLTANEPVEVVATHGGQSFRFSLGPATIPGSERVLWVPVAGTSDPNGIRLEVYSGGRLLHQGTLRSSGRT